MIDGYIRVQSTRKRMFEVKLTKLKSPRWVEAFAAVPLTRLLWEVPWHNSGGNWRAIHVTTADANSVLCRLLQLTSLLLAKAKLSSYSSNVCCAYHPSKCSEFIFLHIRNVGLVLVFPLCFAALHSYGLAIILVINPKI